MSDTTGWLRDRPFVGETKVSFVLRGYSVGLFGSRNVCDGFKKGQLLNSIESNRFGLCILVSFLY